MAIAFVMSRCNAGFIAFFFFGRLSVTVAMPSAMSTRMVSNVMTKRLSVLWLLCVYRTLVLYRITTIQDGAVNRGRREECVDREGRLVFGIAGTRAQGQRIPPGA